MPVCNCFIVTQVHSPEVLQYKPAAAPLFYAVYSINSGYYAPRLSFSSPASAIMYLWYCINSVGG